MVVFNNALAGASGQTGGAAAGYTITRSLRFNSADSAYLSRTPGSTGNQNTCTFSAWLKRSKLGTVQFLFEARDATGDSPFQFNADDTATIGFSDGTYVLTTSQVFRDVSAWYHIVIAFDTTQSTASDRVKLYVNGNQVTQFSSASYPPQNHTFAAWNKSGKVHYISNYTFGGPRLFMDCMLADVHFIDGQALAATDFGEFDATTGVWNPIAYSGSYGTNGFHLLFDNTSNLGEDSAGSNDWTPNNFSVTAGTGNDSLFDSPTNGTQTDNGAGGEISGNYCTWNPNDSSGNAITISNGNLDTTNTTSTYDNLRGTFGMSSGKWYWEVEITSFTGGFHVGLAKPDANLTGSNFVGGVAGSWAYGDSGNKYAEGTSSSYGSSFASVGSKVGVAFDADAGSVVFYLNGTSQGTAFTGLTDGPYLPAVYARVGNTGGTWNFGQRPFAYTAPTGYQPLTTALLDDPTIADGSTAMDVVTYTGTGAELAVTGLTFAPDLVWVKPRSQAASHGLYDVLRGNDRRLSSNQTAAEGTVALELDSNGFTVQGSSSYGDSGVTYVAWTWDGGSSTVSNTDGSVTSSVRANASAGFSIVTATYGSNVNETIGHGLNAAPEFIISKNRDSASSWYCYHKALGRDKYIVLNSQSGEGSLANSWGTADPTSTVFGARSGLAFASGNNTVCYCFAPVESYSAFGSYTGNGSSDGPFVYTGFRPKVIITKAYGTTSSWGIWDTERDAYNPTDATLYPNLSNGEETSGAYPFDILSNGFKVRNTANFINATSGVIYMAWAESPFKYARAR